MSNRAVELVAHVTPADRAELTQVLVHRLFDYNPATGAVLHRDGPRKGRTAVCGVATNRNIKVAGRAIPPRRLIWLWMTGNIPGHVYAIKDLDYPESDSWDNLTDDSVALARRYHTLVLEGPPVQPQIYEPLHRVEIPKIGNMRFPNPVPVPPYSCGDPPFERSALAQRIREQEANKKKR